MYTLSIFCALLLAYTQIFIFLLPKYNLVLHNIRYYLDGRRQAQESRNLISSIQAYLQAGLQLNQALLQISKQAQWCKGIKDTITTVVNFHARGTSLRQALIQTIKGMENKQQQHILLVLNTLQLANNSGVNIVNMLEKLKLGIDSSIAVTRKIRLTTSQIRFQALIISLSPVVLAGIYWLIAPSYILFFINNFIGNILLGIMLILNILAFYFLTKLGKIE